MPTGAEIKLTCRRVEGAANYRKLPLMLEDEGEGSHSDQFVYGTG